MTTAYPLITSKTITSGDTSETLTITNGKYMIVEGFITKTGSLQTYLRFNGVSTGTPYADRKTNNSGAAASDTSANQILLENAANGNPIFFRIFIIQISSQEKLIIGHSMDRGTAGAANAPANDFFVAGKWANTSNGVTDVDIVASTSSFSGGTIVVYGSN